MTDYQKFIRDSSVENNALLGQYNADDKYCIAPEIVQELIKLNKLITVYKQEYLLCETKISDVTLKFIVKFTEDKLEESKFSSLYIIEEYKIANKKHTLETFLVKFKEFNDFDYLTKLKTALNLYTKEDLGEGKDKKNDSKVLEEIISKKKNISKTMLIEMFVDNKKYIQEILKILKSAGKYDAFQKLLKQKTKDLKLDKNSAKYYSTIKKLLDDLVLEHYDEFDEETRKWLEKVNNNYVVIYMNRKKTALNKKQEVASAPAAKKKAAKKKAAAKSSPIMHKSSNPKALNIPVTFDFLKQKQENKENKENIKKVVKPTKQENKILIQDDRKLFDQKFGVLLDEFKKANFVNTEKFTTIAQKAVFSSNSTYYSTETVTVIKETITTSAIKDDGRDL